MNSSTARCPAAFMAINSRKCLAPRVVTASGSTPCRLLPLVEQGDGFHLDVTIRSVVIFQQQVDAAVLFPYFTSVRSLA